MIALSGKGEAGREDWKIYWKLIKLNQPAFAPYSRLFGQAWLTR